MFDEHEGAQDIFMLVLGKIVDMHIMSHFIIQQCFDFIDDSLTVFLSSNCRPEDNLSTRTSTG